MASNDVANKPSSPSAKHSPKLFHNRPFLKREFQENKMRIAIYARVSTHDQDCSQQLTALREYAHACGWEIQGEYVDNGISGTKSSRPAMNRLLDAARKQQLDGIAVWKIDRWGRSMPHFVASVQQLRELGVRFIAITQGIDTDESNPAARLMLNLLAAFAEFERELIVERTRAGLKRANQAGRFGGRPRRVVNHIELIEMHSQGATLREIGECLGISPATTMRILKAHRTQN
jgi:DNA invertase Pin-like site-specific DNA recombinase